MGYILGIIEQFEIDCPKAVVLGVLDEELSEQTYNGLHMHVLHRYALIDFPKTLDNDDDVINLNIVELFNEIKDPSSRHLLLYDNNDEVDPESIGIALDDFEAQTRCKAEGGIVTGDILYTESFPSLRDIIDTVYTIL